MHRIGLALLASALVFAAPAVAVSPSVRFLGTAPVKVGGRGFPPSAKVHVLLVADGLRKVRTVRASTGGRFTVVFVGVSGDRCSGYGVTATGGGTRAGAKIAPHECAPPLTAP